MLKQIARHNIRKNRISQGIKQNDMAVLLGVSRSSYNLLENGHAQITLDRLEQIAKALDVPWEMLLEHKTIDTYTINSFEE